ncbi:hypothetical protein [Intrasporangium sp. YIM S08009]|uniref:hypothetical protein n=1 Tax=Intrasporangium zincisolvens TaxID=3080018 RepID=UPI002B05ADB7|nr:hypothetical protein [Intrasporangium sp. YIM S08009]
MTSPTSTSTPDAAPASVPPTAEASTPTTTDASTPTAHDTSTPTSTDASARTTPDASARTTPDASAGTTPDASTGTTPDASTTPATAEVPSAAPRPTRTRAHVRRLRNEQGDAAREGGVGSALRTAAGAGRRGFDHARTGLARLVWTAALVAAGVLLLGVALVVADANTRNALVEWVLKAADVLDLGVFGRDTGVKQFTGEGAVVKNAVVNWGLGAVAWLVVGRVVRRLLTLGAH